MSLLGFKKSYTAGTFDAAAVVALFANIKTYITNAGFNVIINDATRIDFYKEGTASGTVTDDDNHFAIELVSSTYLDWTPVYGTSLDDVNAKTYVRQAVYPDIGGTDPIDCHFICDSQRGFVLLHFCKPGATSERSMYESGILTGTRRHASDLYQGAVGRYGIWVPWGAFRTAYGIFSDGTEDTTMVMDVWTPLGSQDSVLGYREPASTFPDGMFPCVPNVAVNSYTAHIFGEIENVMQLTKGYAYEAEPVPGWIAFTGDEADNDFAVPKPAVIDVL